MVGCYGCCLLPSRVLAGIFTGDFVKNRIGLAGCRFFITGHSLGGAMAGLAAMRLADEFEAVQRSGGLRVVLLGQKNQILHARSLQVYTFGQPRVGNAIIAHRCHCRWKHKVFIATNRRVSKGVGWTACSSH
eukprot:4973830-Amphidinium_carterae.2